MSRIADNIIPPRGFHYVSPTGYRVPATGEAYNEKDLIKRLQQYRLENLLEVGDAQADIENYICSNFPFVCGGNPTNVSVQTHAAVAPGRGTPVDEINRWANALYENPKKVDLVTQNDANIRAHTCARCPLNVAWEHGCGPCIGQAKRLLATLRQGRDVADGDHLRYCSHHHFDTRTAIHMSEHTLEFGTSPEFCWLHKPS